LAPIEQAQNSKKNRSGNPIILQFLKKARYRTLNHAAVEIANNIPALRCDERIAITTFVCVARGDPIQFPRIL
jgi:hypothetical protein